MPGLFQDPNVDTDELSLPDWLSIRENELAAQRHWLELDQDGWGIPTPSHSVEIREITAKPRDTISKILGTDDPAAIGAFARINGLGRGNSTIYEERPYVLPQKTDLVDSDRGEGLLMIRRDNRRLANIRAQRERGLAESDARAATLVQDEQTSTSSPGDLQRFSQFNRNPYLRMFAGSFADNLGEQMGIAREARDTLSDTLDSLEFVLPLTNPVEDFRKNGFEGSTIGKTVNGATRAADAALPYFLHPSLIGPAIASEAHKLNVQINPTATPAADTATGEFARRIPIASNRGRLEFDIATSVDGGMELRGVNGLNKVRRALEGPALAAKYGPAARAALNELYLKGMGSHYISRATGKKLGIPNWIIDSPFNVSKPPGLTKGEMYMYHAMYDPKFSTARLPRGLERKAWRFQDFDVNRFGPVERLIYGAPPALKATVGGSIGGGVGSGRYVAGSNDRRERPLDR